MTIAPHLTYRPFLCLAKLAANPRIEIAVRRHGTAFELAAEGRYVDTFPTWDAAMERAAKMTRGERP